MTEFYKWAASDFGSFLLITGVIVFGIGVLIEKWKEKP